MHKRFKTRKARSCLCCKELIEGGRFYYRDNSTVFNGGLLGICVYCFNKNNGGGPWVKCSRWVSADVTKLSPVTT